MESMPSNTPQISSSTSPSQLVPVPPSEQTSSKVETLIMGPKRYESLIKKLGTIVTIILLLASAAIGYKRMQDSQQAERTIPPTYSPTPTVEPEGVICTMDAKVCPDGSAVGRTGPKCEFAPCPGETTSSVPSDWRQSGSRAHHFIIRHPQNVNVGEETDGSMFASLWGPTQQTNTEFYDGISIRFFYRDLNGSTLQQRAEEEMVMAQEHTTLTKSLTPIEINGVSGYSFAIEGMGTFEYILLPWGERGYMTIINATRDPGNLGYGEITQQIIQSIEYTKE